MTEQMPRIVILILVFFLIPCMALAQEPASTSKEAAVSMRGEARALPSEFDSRKTREELVALLERHPREVGVVLKLDPSLFRNEGYLASYPALASFVREHPEVAQNAPYFLESVRVPGDYEPESPAVRASRNMMEGLLIFAVVLLVTGTFTWLIRTLLEHRRWSRVSKVQTEIHNKLLDRFTSHEDLLRYVQSASGKQFLEAASTPLFAGSQPGSAPLNRILWSMQVGVVLAAIGIGAQVVSARAHPDIAGSIFGFGVIALCGGLGFIVSAAVGYVLSRKLGLVPSGEAVTSPRDADV